MTTTKLFADLIAAAPDDLRCLLFVLLVALVAQVGLYGSNRYGDSKTTPPSNEVIGIIFGTISLIYSLVLAFVILAVWEDYEDLNKTIAREADELNSILAHSATLPDSLQQPIKTTLFSYCRQVVEQEWQMNPADFVQRPSAIPELRLLLLQLEPRNKSEEGIYAVLDENLSRISDLRRNRLSHNESHVPDLVWFILKAGSAMLIIFYYYLHVPSVRLKQIYLLFLSGYIAMCLFLVYTLDQPFAGKVPVSPQPYTAILTSLKPTVTLNQN